MKRKKKALKIYDVIDAKEEEIIKAIYEKNKQFFDKAVELLKLAYKILPLNGKPFKSGLHLHVQRTLLALYTASFRFFRSVIISCKSGLDLEAQVQLRSLLEVISYLLYIAEKDHYDRLEHYLHSRALSQKTAVEQFLCVFPKERPNLNIKWYEEKYDEAIKYFISKHGKEITRDDIKKKYTLRADIAGQSTQDKIFVKHYQTFYRYASTISHGENIFEYIKPTNNPTRFLLKVMPTDNSTQFCLAQGTAIIFLAIKRMNELLKLGKDVEIKNIDKELGDFLYKKYTEPIIEKSKNRNKLRKEKDGQGS